MFINAIYVILAHRFIWRFVASSVEGHPHIVLSHWNFVPIFLKNNKDFVYFVDIRIAYVLYIICPKTEMKLKTEQETLLDLC